MNERERERERGPTALGGGGGISHGRGPITRRSFPREAFPRDDTQRYVTARSARKRTLVHHRAETLRAEKIGALSDLVPAPVMSVCQSVCPFKWSQLDHYNCIVYWPTHWRLNGDFDINQRRRCRCACVCQTASVCVCEYVLKPRRLVGLQLVTKRILHHF